MSIFLKKIKNNFNKQIKNKNTYLINTEKKPIKNLTKKLELFIGNTFDDKTPIYLPEKSLFQNILITGTIGTGKTSSAMYPFTKQLIEYCSKSPDSKIGMLVLDVKGNIIERF